MNEIKIKMYSVTSYLNDYYSIDNIDASVLEDIVTNQKLPEDHDLKLIGSVCYLDPTDSEYFVYQNGECINEDDYTPIADLMTVVVSHKDDKKIVSLDLFRKQQKNRGVYPNPETEHKTLAVMENLHKVELKTGIPNSLSPINTLRVELMNMGELREETPCLVVDTYRYSEYTYEFNIEDEFTIDKLNFIADPFNHYTHEENGEIICADFIGYDGIICYGKPELVFNHNCTLITKTTLNANPIDHPNLVIVDNEYQRL